MKKTLIFFLILGLGLFIKIPSAYAGSCTATYNLNPASPVNANTDITVTFPTINTTYNRCLALFKDDKNTSVDGGSCSLVGSNNVLTCIVKSGANAGNHTLQLRYGQSAFYPGVDCGSPLNCNSINFQTNAPSVPTPTPTPVLSPIPPPASASSVCSSDGTKAELTWSKVSGANAYTLRFNNNNRDTSLGWMKLHDMVIDVSDEYACTNNTCTFTTGPTGSDSNLMVALCTNSTCSPFSNGPSNIVKGDPYGWAVESVNTDTGQRSGLNRATGGFTCNSPTPTSTPTPTSCTVSGDFNGNGKVNNTDYEIWKNAFINGIAISATNCNIEPSAVDLLPFNTWRTECAKKGTCGQNDP